MNNKIAIRIYTGADMIDAIIDYKDKLAFEYVLETSPIVKDYRVFAALENDDLKILEEEK